MDAALAGILFVLILLILMLSSCKHQPDVLPNLVKDETLNTGNGNTSTESTCDPDSAYFQTQVLPILISNCAKSGCHDATTHEEGIILNNYSNIMVTGDVRAGRADQTDIYKVLIETDPDKRMPPPPENALSNAQVNLIFKWIEQGARNNTCSNNCDTLNVTYTGTIFPIIQNSCMGCHSGASPDGQIDLTTYQNIFTVAQNGKLFGAVNHSQGYQFMPKGGSKLPDCQVDEIRIWIENGALNN